MQKVSKKIIKGILFFIFILSSLFCFSQQKYNVRGKIITSDKDSIQKYNVIVLQNENSLGNTQEYEFHDENFSVDIDKVPSDLLITAIGYKDTVVHIGSENISDLTIAMRKSEINLSEILVKGILPVFHNKKGKMEVQVANTALSETGSALDILQKAPKVKVDEKYGIFLGIDQATIYLNGRQISSRRALEMVSSRDIEKIELITNPSVKYDSNTNVIIDIITKNKGSDVEKSLDIDLTGRMTKGEYWRQYTQAEIRANYSKLSLYSSFSFAPEKKLYKETYARNVILGKQELFSVSDINSLYDTDHNNRVMIGGTYDIDDRHSIGLEGNIQVQKGERNDNQIESYYLTPESDKLLKQRDSYKTTDYNRVNYTGGFYHSFKNKSGYYQKTIIDIYDYEDNTKRREDVTINSNGKIDTINVINQNDVKNNLFALRTDLSVPFGEKFKFDAGAKYQYTRARSQFQLLQNYNSIYSNTYKNDDKSAALYSMGTYSSEKIRIEAGFRIEYINNKYVNSDPKLLSRDTVRWSIVPNVSFNYKFTDNWSLDVSYTQNIQRPTFEELNPQKTEIDPLFYKIGNPSLEDERRNNFSIKGNYKDRSLAFTYIRRNNAITWVMDREPGNPSITRSTHLNMKKAETFTVDAVIPYRSEPFNIFVSTGVIHSNIEAYNTEMSMNQTLWYGTANLDFNLPFDIKLNTNHRYFTKGLMQVFYFKPSYRADLSLKKTFLKDKLSAIFMWNDIFKTDKMKTYTDMNGQNVSYNYSYDQSTMSLTLTYSFSLK